MVETALVSQSFDFFSLNPDWLKIYHGFCLNPVFFSHKNRDPPPFFPIKMRNQSSGTLDEVLSLSQNEPLLPGVCGLHLQADLLAQLQGF